MISAYIDRYEEEFAVLLLGEEQKKVNFPKKFLPKGLTEGDYLKLHIERDDEKTESAIDEALAFGMEDV